MNLDCYCWECRKDNVVFKLDDGHLKFYITEAMNRVFLCPICGHKRCPHATSHKETCTGSNEPGQLGSTLASIQTQIVDYWILWKARIKQILDPISFYGL